MSAFGPAIFIKRKDQQPISDQEKEALSAEIDKSCKEFQFLDDAGDPVTPSIYDYRKKDETLVILMYASAAFSMMPEEVQADQQILDREQFMELAAPLDESFPGQYEVDCYYIEC